MRISDWSSDVCSSDLVAGGPWEQDDDDTGGRARLLVRRSDAGPVVREGRRVRRCPAQSLRRAARRGGGGRARRLGDDRRRPPCAGPGARPDVAPPVQGDRTSVGYGQACVSRCTYWRVTHEYKTKKNKTRK